MAKARSGYVYQESRWCAVVIYKDADGKRQTIKRRAHSEAHAGQLISKIAARLDHPVESSNARLEKGSWVARVTYTDGAGKRHSIKRAAETKTGAKELLKQIVREIDDHGTKLLEYSRMTFTELADYFEQNYAKEPEYIGGRKIAGLRSWKSVRYRISILKDYFGKKEIRSIRYIDIQWFRNTRLKTPILGKSEESKSQTRQRSIACVNRDLGVLKRILNMAVSHGWLIRNPFNFGDPLITPGYEKQRDRILSREEEERLLAACVGRCAHLRPILICAIDTGMRRGEVLTLRWSDINFANRIITIRAFNTKTLRGRQVPISLRLLSELKTIYQHSTQHPEDLVFRAAGINNAFNTVRASAGLPELRMHDLRHTFASRLVASGMELPGVARLLGHTSPQMAYRYVHIDADAIQRAADMLNEYNEQPGTSI